MGRAAVQGQVGEGEGDQGRSRERGWKALTKIQQDGNPGWKWSDPASYFEGEGGRCVYMGCWRQGGRCVDIYELGGCGEQVRGRVAWNWGWAC